MFVYYTSCLAFGVLLGYSYALYENHIQTVNQTIQVDFHDLE
jgi:hypothetical protein